jgi:O-antigen/teichoic acid export membrane protein
MQPAKRIIINTIASYGQSVFGLCLSLFSARWVLQALGQSDFGLFGVVGSLILLITFLSGGLSVGVSRFYAYSIGQGQNVSDLEALDDLKRWFNTAFLLHIVVPFVLIIIGWPIGEHAIRHWLTIPAERIDACVWVFRLSVVNGFVGVFSVPFVSMFRAHQLIFELALFGVLRSCAVFVVAWSMLRVSSDRLVTYAVCMMVVSVTIQLLQIFRACMKFDACRVKSSYLYDPVYWKKLFGFVGWKMFGMSCVALRGQGGPVLINLLFGPLVNAAYSVANQVSIQSTTLSSSMTQAFQPALISAEGKGDRQGALLMSIQVCKFGALLVLIFAIPLILEMQTLLDLWLVEPPAYSAQLCQWMLSMLVIDRMTSGPMLGINAYGKIAVYEFVQGGVLFLALPLIWVLYRAGFGPNSIGCALFATMVLYCLGRILFARRLLSYPVALWFKKVLLPVALLVCISASVGWLVVCTNDTSFVRLVSTSAATFLVTSLIAWLQFFDAPEKRYVIGVIKNKVARFSKSKH